MTEIYEPETSLIDKHAKKLKTGIQTDIYMPIFIVALLKKKNKRAQNNSSVCHQMNGEQNI